MHLRAAGGKGRFNASVYRKAGYARYSVQVGYWRNMGHPNSRTPKSETIERSQNRVEPRGSLTPVPVAEWLQLREIFIAIDLEPESFL